MINWHLITLSKIISLQNYFTISFDKVLINMFINNKLFYLKRIAFLVPHTFFSYLIYISKLTFLFICLDKIKNNIFLNLYCVILSVLCFMSISNYYSFFKLRFNLILSYLITFFDEL